MRARLLDVRAPRPQPGRDDKVVAAWNGLAIAALAESGVLLDRPDHLAAAVACADLLRDLHTVDGRLLRTSIGGRAGRHAGVLEDHADVAEGLLALFAATGDVATAGRRAACCSTPCCEHFPDGAGGFYDTADDAEQLVRRPQDPTDGADALGPGRRRRGAADGLGDDRVGALPRRCGGGAVDGGAAAEALGPLRRVGGRRRRGARWQVRPRWWSSTVPTCWRSHGAPPRQARSCVTAGPLAQGRPGGAAYVCRRSVCDAPTTEADRLAEQLHVVVGS